MPIAVCAFALFLLMSVFRAQILAWTWILDFVNLAFHEAGHVVFGLLGNRFIMVAGGTAMQLLMPAACAGHFWRRRERVSAAATAAWFGQNFLGIGRYVADARAQRLDLVGGGEHDWTYLLETLGVLIHDEAIGRTVQITGCLIMAASAACAYFFWRLDADG